MSDLTPSPDALVHSAINAYANLTRSTVRAWVDVTRAVARPARDLGPVEVVRAVRRLARHRELRRARVSCARWSSAADTAHHFGDVRKGVRDQREARAWCAALDRMEGHA